mgnify:CR=1 FL=1
MYPLLQGYDSVVIDADLEIVETALWVPKLVRREYQFALSQVGNGVDDPDQNYPENYACGSRTYMDYCDKEVDALVCAAPNHWHATATVRACEAGKHVYVEKPFTPSREEAAAVLRALGAQSQVLSRLQSAELWGTGALSGTLAAALALVVAWLLAREVFDFSWQLPWWVLPLGGFMGAAVAAAVGWWTLRVVLRQSVTQTLRQSES